MVLVRSIFGPKPLTLLQSSAKVGYTFLGGLGGWIPREEKRENPPPPVRLFGFQVFGGEWLPRDPMHYLLRPFFSVESSDVGNFFGGLL